jgi:hypothetical protein
MNPTICILFLMLSIKDCILSLGWGLNMADFAPLQALVHAIASAVNEAQQEVAKAQILNFFNYLDREQRPLTLQLRVPSIRPEAGPGEEDFYQAPLLALVPHSVLRIKQAEISFDIQLGDLSKPVSTTKSKTGTPASLNAADALAARLSQSLNVNTAVSAAVTRQGTSAHVVLTIEGADPSESVSRLVMEVAKTQGISGPVVNNSKA